MISYYAECHILFTIVLNVLYAKFCYAECRSAECRGACKINNFMVCKNDTQDK